MLNAAGDYLREAPFFVFAFCFGIPLLIAVASVFAAAWAWRNANALSAAGKPVPPGGLSPGYHLVQGHIEGSAVKAPLTGRPCAWYEYRVDESRRMNSTDRNSQYSWSRVSEGESRKSLTITDGTSACAVDPRDATVYATDWSEWYGPSGKPDPGDDPERHPGHLTPGGAGRIESMRDPDRRFRYFERYIHSGDPAFAIGMAESRGKGYRISAPDGKRPFIISTRSPDDIAHENRIAIQGGLIMAVVMLALAAFVAMLRFG